MLLAGPSGWNRSKNARVFVINGDEYSYEGGDFYKKFTGRSAKMNKGYALISTVKSKEKDTSIDVLQQRQDGSNPYKRRADELAFMQYNVKSLKTISISNNLTAEEFLKFYKEISNVRKKSLGVKLDIKGLDTLVLFFDRRASTTASLREPFSSLATSKEDVEYYLDKYHTDKINVLEISGFFSTSLLRAKSSGNYYEPEGRVVFYIDSEMNIAVEPKFKWAKAIGESRLFRRK